MVKALNIVIVDDVLVNCLLLKKNLEAEGFTNVVHYLSAKDAISELSDSTSLVLMDIMMPEMDGIEAVTQIRKMYNRQQLPIIMVTAANQQQYLKQAFKSGANDYVTKPVDRIEFLARVRACLELKQLYDRQIQYESILKKIIEKQQAQKIKIENELELAKQIQKNLLPRTLLTDGLKIYGELMASNRLSGDFYYWKAISDYQYGVIIIDIMGHDVSASMVAMSIRSLLSGIISRIQDPKAVMLELNKHMISLYQNKQAIFSDIEYYFTAMYIYIDLKENLIKYVNSGHPPGMLFTGKSELHLLDKGSPPIGLFPKLTIEEGELPFNHNDRIILYTDGIFDLLEPNHAAQLEYLSTALNKYKAYSAESLVYNIMNNTNKKTDIINDDVTLLVIERN